jgi:hypothetical protein
MRADPADLKSEAVAHDERFRDDHLQRLQRSLMTGNEK